MVSTIMSVKDFNVSVDAFDDNGDIQFGHVMNELTFMQAADYAEHAVNYFKFAMLDHPDWCTLHIEINNPMGLIELIEIQRDRA